MSFKVLYYTELLLNNYYSLKSMVIALRNAITFINPFIISSYLCQIEKLVCPREF